MKRSLIYVFVLCLVVNVGCRPDEKDPSTAFDLTDEQDMSVDASMVPDMALNTPDMVPSVPDMAPDMPPVEDMFMTVEDIAPDMIDMPEDMAPDQAPDMPAPLRQERRRGLMGDMPVENYFKDPTFNTLNTAYTWLVTPAQGGQQGFSLLPAYRHVTSTAPMRTSSLLVPKGSGNSVAVYGEVNLHSGVSVNVSVWIGRKGITLGGNSSAPEVSVYAMNIANFRDYSGVTLTQVPNSTVSDDGIRWTKYEVQTSGMAGYGYLTINDSASGDLYLHAPMAVAIPPSPLATGMAPATPRLVTSSESDALKQINNFVLEKRSIPAAAHDTGPTPYPF